MAMKIGGLGGGGLPPAPAADVSQRATQLGRLFQNFPLPGPRPQIPLSASAAPTLHNEVAELKQLLGPAQAHSGVLHGGIGAGLQAGKFAGGLL